VNPLHDGGIMHAASLATIGSDNRQKVAADMPVPHHLWFALRLTS